jgi:hypothetical protein
MEGIIVAFLELLVVLLDGIGLACVGADVLVQAPALVLIEDFEERNDLAIDVRGGAVGPGHAAPGDDDGPEQAAVGVAHCVDVRVVHPEDRTAVHGTRTGALGDRPDVDVHLAGHERYPLPAWAQRFVTRVDHSPVRCGQPAARGITAAEAQLLLDCLCDSRGDGCYVG